MTEDELWDQGAFFEHHLEVPQDLSQGSRLQFEQCIGQGE